MKTELNKRLALGIALYGAYVVAVVVANYLMDQAVATGNEDLEAMSGMVFGFVAVPVFSIALPMVLAKRWGLDFSFWPKTTGGWKAFVVVLAVMVVAIMGDLQRLLSSGIRLEAFAVHFVSTMFFHCSYYPLFAMVLFPLLRQKLGLEAAMGLTAAAFSLYHLAQYHFYPAGLSIEIQLYLFAYFLVSLVFYLSTQSIILTAGVHQLVASLSVAANGSVHSEADFLFYLTMVVIGVTLGYMVIRIVRKKDRENFKPSFWLSPALPKP